jgi:hypothetical protein
MPRDATVASVTNSVSDARGAPGVRLHISLRTERNHVANILAKLGVHSHLQALVFALRYVVEIQ